MKRFTVISLLILSIFGVGRISPAQWTGVKPEAYESQKIRLDTDKDGSFQELSETDISQRVNITNYSTAPEEGVPTYSGTGTSWVCRGLSEIGLDPANIITVGKSGCDFTSIGPAIEAASNGYVIMIYPGTYTLSSVLNVNKAVALVGTDREKCVIEMDNLVTGAIGYTSGVVNCTIGNTALMNLTIKNIGDGDGTNTTPAVICSSGACYIYNCKIMGNGGRDIFDILNTANVECVNVETVQYKITSNASHPIWVCNSASLKYHFSKVTVLGSGDGIQLNTSGDCNFYYVIFDTGNYAIDSAACGALEIYHCGLLDGNQFFYGTPSYSTFDTNMTDGLTGYLSSIVLGNLWNISGGSLISTLSGGGNTNIRIMPYDSGNALDMRIEWGTGDPNVYDTDLYRDTGGILRTGNPFSAASYKVDTTEIVDSSRNAAFAGLNATSSVWQDFPAVSSAHGNVAGYDVQDTGPTSYEATGWMVNAVNSPTYVKTANDGACAYFLIPYNAGSVLTRACVKWQAQGHNDGVKLRLVKRDESSGATTWTTVGSQQTYTDSSAPYDITPDSIYDFDDETMASRTAYAIEIESEVAATGANLFSVGIESSKRVY